VRLLHRRRGRNAVSVEDLPAGDEPGEPEPEEGQEDTGDPGTESDEDDGEEAS